MNHKELVERAERWLRNTLHCRVVLPELKAWTATGEIPDVMGWKNGQSIMVECKTSAADFKRDMKKGSRILSRFSLGNWRFFLAPKGVISGYGLPFGWGLYEVHGRSVAYIKGFKYNNVEVGPFKSHKHSEVAMLVSALSRLNKSTKEKV